VAYRCTRAGVATSDSRDSHSEERAEKLLVRFSNLRLVNCSLSFNSRQQYCTTACLSIASHYSIKNFKLNFIIAPFLHLVQN